MMVMTRIYDADGNEAGDLFGMMFGAEHAMHDRDGNPIPAKLYDWCMSRADMSRDYHDDDGYNAALCEAIGWASRMTP